MLLPQTTTIIIFNPQGTGDILETHLQKFLTKEEKFKYQKMDQISRKDFAAGRVALGEALANFTKTKSISLVSKIKINYEKLGKPFFEGNKDLEISISHSSGWGAALVSNSKYVAIDIEKIKRRNTSTIKYVLSEKEQNLIKTKITDEILTIFWTMKESIMKALGIGLISPNFIVLESFLLYDNIYIANFRYHSNQTTEIRSWTTKTALVDNYAISVVYPYKLHESIIFDWNIKIGLQTTKQMSIS